MAVASSPQTTQLLRSYAPTMVSLASCPYFRAVRAFAESAEHDAFTPLPYYERSRDSFLLRRPALYGRQGRRNGTASHQRSGLHIFPPLVTGRNKSRLNLAIRRY